MLRLLLPAGSALLLAAVALGVFGAREAWTATHQVDATGTNGNYSFSPASITVAVGDSIEWSFEGDAPHTVTSTSGPASFDSGVRQPGDPVFTATFNTAGTVNYVCEVHGASMSGTVTVQQQATATSTGQATNTPVTGTPTRTRTATTAPGTATTTPQTPIPAVTATPPPSSPTAARAVPTTAGAPTGVPGQAVRAPSTGTGIGSEGDGAGWATPLAFALGAAGASMLGGWFIVRRRIG